MEIRVYQQVEKTLRLETAEIRQDVQDILEKIEAGVPLGVPHIKPLVGMGAGLYEIRVHDRAGQFRVIYFIKKGIAIYLLHAFRKKTRKIPEKDKNTIMKRFLEIYHAKD